MKKLLYLLLILSTVASAQMPSTVTKLKYNGILVPNKPVEFLYGAYAGKIAALAATAGYRYKGMTIGIDSGGIIYDYQFKTGITDVELVPKYQASTDDIQDVLSRGNVSDLDLSVGGLTVNGDNKFIGAVRVTNTTATGFAVYDFSSGSKQGRWFFGMRENSDDFNFYNFLTNRNAINISSATDDISLAGKLTTPQFNLSALNTAPSSSSDAGTTGETRDAVDGGIYYHYLCIATNTWVRFAYSTW